MGESLGAEDHMRRPDADDAAPITMDTRRSPGLPVETIRGSEVLVVVLVFFIVEVVIKLVVEVVVEIIILLFEGGAGQEGAAIRTGTSFFFHIRHQDV
jgi:hypothetical protein